MKDIIKEGLCAVGVATGTMVVLTIVSEASAFMYNRKRIKKMIKEGKGY